MSDYVNPFKSGSRKAAIYDAFKSAKTPEKGLEAAQALAKKEGIKEGTVKSWSGGWMKGNVPTPKPKGEKVVKEKGAPTTRAVMDKEFHPLFKYNSRERADAAHETLCTRAGLRPHAFHVIEDEGKFAVAPSNYKPGGPVPTFMPGDIVYDALIINSKAKVIEAGPQQTIVRYVKDRPNRPREDCIINRFLIKLPDEPVKAKVKREKIEPDNKKLASAAKASGALAMKAKPKREKL